MVLRFSHSFVCNQAETGPHNSEPPDILSHSYNSLLTTLCNLGILDFSFHGCYAGLNRQMKSDCGSISTVSLAQYCFAGGSIERGKGAKGEAGLCPLD